MAIVTCAQCGQVIDEPINTPEAERTQCPSCGSRERLFKVHIANHSTGHARLRLKARHGSTMKPFLESKDGEEVYRKKGKWVRRLIKIDRDHDRYLETIIDQETREVIHHCDEPLSQHRGHGSTHPKEDSNDVIHRIEGAGGIDANLAPDAFHRWATHYYKCKNDFESPQRFSPVPYFLLCRAIELEIKSKHLRNKNQDQIKVEFGHNLLRAYECLEDKDKILSIDEVEILKSASEIYCSKGFEYFDPKDALTGYSKYPNLDILDAIANKLIEHKA